MSVRRIRRLLFVLGMALAAAGLTPTPAHAAANDDIDGATVIDSLPADVAADTSATAAADDPPDCSTGQSVWWRLTAPVSGQIALATTDHSHFVTIAVYTGTRGGLHVVPGGCGGLGQRVHFTATAGTAYYIELTACCGTRFDLIVDAVTQAANDDFATATRVSAVPFTDTVVPLATSRQPGEPTASCDYDGDGTAWYAFRPRRTRSVTLTAADAGLVVYRGHTLDGLTELACHASSDGPLTFHAIAGRTYLIQLSQLRPRGAPVTFSITLARRCGASG